MSRKSPPLFSVIIPTYNYQQFLSEAIDSVLRQTCQDFEIIVVDDGSTDDTRSIVATYPSVRYFWQTNQGLAAARNTGIQKSTGRYLVFLDADDKLLLGALEANLKCFQMHPECGFVFGRFRRLTLDGIAIAPQPVINGEHYLALLQRNYIVMHATVTYRRDVIENVGGFNASLLACEDYDLYLRIARLFPVAQHDEIVADYRIHGANMSRRHTTMLSCALQVLREQRQNFENQLAFTAYKTGIISWRNYFGRKILKGLKAEVRVCQRVCSVVVLFRLAPQFVFLQGLKRIALKVLSISVYRTLRRRFRSIFPVGQVELRDLRRPLPISSISGSAADNL